MCHPNHKTGAAKNTSLLLAFPFWVSSTNRPCFDRGHGLSDGRVFLDIDGAVDGLVPHGGLVGAVNHVDLDLDRPRERALAAVLGYGLELVRLPLQGRGYEDVEGGVRVSFSFFLLIAKALCLAGETHSLTCYC